jgi:quercetin dioxygenase-like cupin family protein
MAKSGDVLEHPVTGESVIWRKVAAETQGRLLQGDLFARPGGHVAASHVHPKQEERFEVLSGTLKLRIDGEDRLLSPGDVAVIPAGRSHVWWNAGEEDVHILGEFRPALRTEVFFETFFGLAADGKTNRKGLPNPIQLAVLMREYEDEVHLASPPLRAQKALFTPLAAVGWLVEYRGWYPKYSADPLTEFSELVVSDQEQKRGLGS